MAAAAVSTCGMVAGDVTGDKRLLVSGRPTPSLASLSVLTTNQKGLIAEMAVIAECVSLGIGVSRPLDDERYDLILDLRPRLIRVQCKWASRCGDVVSAGLYSNRRGPDRMITKRYTPDEIDCFAVHCAELERSFLIPAETCRMRQIRLRLGPTKNNQAIGIRWAQDYEFAAKLRPLVGAVAQLGERDAGSVEATGSSPVRSTRRGSAETSSLMRR